jgi:hypothetical protein
VRKPDLGTVIFEEVEQLNCFAEAFGYASRQQFTGQSSMSSRTRVL